MTYEELVAKVEEVERRNKKKPAKKVNNFYRMSVHDGIKQSRENVQKSTC